MKNNKLKERKDIDDNYKWKLEDIFESNEKWEEQYKLGQKLIEECTKLSGSIKSSQSLKAVLDKINEMELCVEELFVYARMRRDENNQDSTYQALADRAMQLYVGSNSAQSFLVPEILSIEEDVLNGYMKSDRALDTYEHFITKINDLRAHTLSHKEEKLLAMAGEMANAPDIIYSMLCDADMTFESVEHGGKIIEITHGNFITLMENEDRELRRKVFSSYYSTYKKSLNTLSATYSSSIKKDIFYSRAKKYASCLEMELKDDNVDIAVYDSLIKAVHDALPYMHEYMRIKKKELGVDELHMYDLYVPIVKDFESEISYEEAKKIITDGLSPLGDKYISVMKEGLDSGTWVDIYENAGKSSGAYSWGVWGKHPYVMMNWTATLDEVFTLAHEFGHAMHSYLSDTSLPYHQAQYPIILAEIASTCNEALLLNYMLENSEDAKEKKYLINHYLEQFRTTLFRQVMFAEFEKIAHDKAEQGIGLTPDVLNKIYRDLNIKYYGKDMVIDEEIDVEWARIPHFYRAFYVYKYATGFASAMVLSRKILEGSDDERENYLNFLKSGGKKYPLDILREAGVDLNKPETVKDALKIFGELVKNYS